MYAVEIKNDAVKQALARLATGLHDKSELMNDIGQELARSSRERITQGISPDGTPFAPLSQTTLDRYASEGKVSQGPLRQSGDMQKGIFHSYTADSAEVGSNAIQAGVMQLGAAAGAFGQAANGSAVPWGAIPARPFLGLSEEDEQAIPEIIEDWLAGLISE